MPRVNPEILIWARETAGLTQEAAAKKLGFQDSSRSSAVEKLAVIEHGLKEPSRPQVLKMAGQYRRPLLAFYLSKPPRREDRGTDFRTSSIGRSAEADAQLDALIRDIRVRQSMVRSVLEEEEEAEPLAYVGSYRMEAGPEAVTASLRNLLNVELQEYRAQHSASAAFDLLRSGAEMAGIFVLIKGDLGNYRTAIDTDTFRGFSIADNVAPFIVINDQDARSAWSFTLLHEMTHLLLGQTGVGNAQIENEDERFCERVAGYFLLPERELNGLNLSSIDDFNVVSERISRFADERKLGRTMVAYHAYAARLIDQATFAQLRNDYFREWYSGRERIRELARGQEGGPNYYTVRRHRLGDRTVNLVRRMMAAEALSTSKAARILGVAARQVRPLLNNRYSA